MINFLLGQQTQNVQQEIINSMVADYQKDKSKQYLLLVPNHIKFDTEVLALKTLADQTSNTGSVSVKNLQVLSFSRLAWYLQKDAPRNGLRPLSDAAASMILARILKELQPELVVYHDVKINRGIIAQIYQSLLEIQRSNFTPDDFNEIDLAKITNPEIQTTTDVNTQAVKLETANKIHDLQLIYNRFAEEIAWRFATKQENLTTLNEYLAEHAEILQDTSFYLTDFGQFSAQEMVTLKILLAKARQTTIGFKTKTGAFNPLAKNSDYDGYVQLILKNLTNFCEQKHLEYQYLSASETATNTEITLLNKLWSNQKLPEKPLITKNIQFVTADNRYSEAYFVAQTIYREIALNKQEGESYRYQDFIILTPSLKKYETHLGPIFNQLNIPYFNDLQKEMKYHPLVVFVEALQDLFVHPLNSESLFKLLKTNLIKPDNISVSENQRLIDSLENFSLKYGINFGRWHRDLTDFLDQSQKDQVWAKKLFEQTARLNAYKNTIITEIEDFLTKFAKANSTDKALSLLLNFFNKLEIPSRLEDWRANAIAADDLQLAQQPEEVWSTFNQLLDDYRLINPEDFSATDFFDTIIAGFSEATFSQIPSTLDAVTISEIGMVQSNRYKVCFIMGSVTGDLPKYQNKPKFLASENLEQLNAQFTEDKFIEDGAKTNNLLQNFQFGQAITTGHERLFLSYPLIDEENNTQKPSIFYEQLRKKTNLPEYNHFDLPVGDGANLGSYLATPLSSAAYLSYLINDPASETETRNKARDLLKYTRTFDDQKINEFLEAQEFNNTPAKLEPEQTVALFGQNLVASISQIEAYYRDPYEYFLNYGLKLRKRDLNELDNMQTGNYFHEILDEFIRAVNQNGRTLADYDDTETKLILQKIERNVLESSKFKYYFDDTLNQYLATRLNGSVETLVDIMRSRLDKTILVPKYSEVTFGQNKLLNGLSYQVADHQVELSGKIDRIDLAELEQKQLLAQVIDYKSSAKQFDFNLFSSGIMIQLVSYLKVIQSNAEFFGATPQTIQPVGAFYQDIVQKNYNLSKLTFDQWRKSEGEINQQIETNLSKQINLNGISINEQLVMDNIVDSHYKKTEIYKSIAGKNQSFTKDNFAKIEQLNDDLITAAAQKIYAGNFPIAPYRNGDQNALTYSDYKDILFFDVLLPENKYNIIQKHDLAKFLTGEDENNA